jgi:multiple sugar transport system permease protein
MAAIPGRERVQRWAWGTERLREALVGYAFILVPMGFFLLFFIFPIGYAVYISRYDWGIFGKIDFVGWGNYRTLYHDEIFRRAVRNTLEYGVAVVVLEVALGLALAVVVNQTLRFRTFYRAGFYFPSIASSAAITAIAIFVLQADGLLNSFLGVFGYHTNRPWFYESNTALWSIVGLNAWTTSGTIMLFYLAALQAIPVEVYEAAAIDGARAWRTFWKITFPLLKPAHFFVLVVSVIGALQIFDQAYLVAGPQGGPDYSTMTVVLYLYNKAIANVQFGYAAAVGVVLFVGIFAITLVQRLLFGRPEVA